MRRLRSRVVVIGLLAVTACGESSTDENAVRGSSSDGTLFQPVPTPTVDTESVAEDTLQEIRSLTNSGCPETLGPGVAGLLAAGHDWFELRPNHQLPPPRDPFGTNTVTLEARRVEGNNLGDWSTVEFRIPGEHMKQINVALSAPSLNTFLAASRDDQLPPGWVEFAIAMDGEAFAVLSECNGAYSAQLEVALAAGEATARDIVGRSIDEIRSVLGVADPKVDQQAIPQYVPGLSDTSAQPPGSTPSTIFMIVPGEPRRRQTTEAHTVRRRQEFSGNALLSQSFMVRAAP